MPQDGVVVQVGGNYATAIRDASRFDLVGAELHLGGANAGVQTFEVMSTDTGSVAKGLRRNGPGYFPIGTLRVASDAGVLELHDLLDNDGDAQGASEALYVRHLVIEDGATVVTGGLKVYYGTMTSFGSVDVSANLVRVLPEIEDFDGDFDVDLFDHAALIDCLSGPVGGALPAGCAGTADLDGDGDADLADLRQFQSAFTGQ